MKIYISGKITGLPIGIAKMMFSDAEKKIRQLGHIPINPMTWIPYDENKKWSDYMIEDIKLLFNAEGIYMISNWKDSKGARIEHNIAIETNKIIIYQ
jgi:hypothetical protein